MIIESILALCTSLETCSFNFYYRKCNAVAHRLAKWASTVVCDEVWCNVGPQWIEEDVVCADLI